MSKASQKQTIPEKNLPPSFRRAKPVVLPQKGYTEHTESQLVEKFTPMVVKWVHRLAYHPSLKEEIEDFRNIGYPCLILLYSRITHLKSFLVWVKCYPNVDHVIVFSQHFLPQ